MKRLFLLALGFGLTLLVSSQAVRAVGGNCQIDCGDGRTAEINMGSPEECQGACDVICGGFCEGSILD